VDGANGHFTLMEGQGHARMGSSEGTAKSYIRRSLFGVGGPRALVCSLRGLKYSCKEEWYTPIIFGRGRKTRWKTTTADLGGMWSGVLGCRKSEIKFEEELGH